MVHSGKLFYTGTMKYLFWTLLLCFIGCESTPTKPTSPSATKPLPTIRVGLIDTAICQQDLYTQFKNVKIKAPILFLEPSYSSDCKKLPRFKPAIHGHFVLTNFLHALSQKLKVELTPLVIFNNKGFQSLEGWRKVDDHLKLEKYDLLITASGYPLTTKDDLSALPNIETWPFTFLSSGQIGRRVSRKTKLFPQSFTNNNMLLVGSYISPKRSDQKEMIFDGSLLNQDKIIFYARGGKRSPLRGSSKAVALFAARALNSCAHILHESHESFRLCLIQKSEPFKFFNMPDKKARRLPVVSLP